MTTQEWAGVVARLSSYWPSLKMTQVDVALWFERLKFYEIADVEGGLERLLQAGEDFMSLAKIVNAVERFRQGPPPGWIAAHKTIARHITKLDYHDPMSTWDTFVAAVSAEHESIGRFVIALGNARTVREMPDPSVPQTSNSASVSITRFEKEYRGAVAEWESNPLPGLALEEAHRLACLRHPGGLAAVLDGLRPAAELEAGAA